MRRLTLLFFTFGLAACQPSDLVKDRGNADKEEMVDVPVEAIAFPTGVWSDGHGNSWEIKRDAFEISGMAIQGPARGFLISGEIIGESLIYKITDSSNSPVSIGSARLIHAAHAWFEAEQSDGAPASHGVFHFDHEAEDLGFTRSATSRAPRDLRPIPELEGG